MLSVRTLVEDTSRVSEARRAAVDVAAGCGFPESDAGRVALIATEAATNVLRHAGGGEMVVSAIRCQGRTGVQLVVMDRGPGMADVQRCLQDGYSTSGSSGTGMGAIGRLSSESSFYSLPGKGTVVLSRVWAGETPGWGALEWGSVVVPLRGEKVCGDACSARLEGRDLAVLMSDGLGHGPGAAEASLAAVGVFEEQSGLDHAELLERIHGALRGTRGAAVALVRFSPGECTVQFTGVGNISGVLMSAGSARQMISYPGTVGMEMRKVQTMSYPWADSTLAVLHSDGIATHWSLEPYAGLERQDPAVIAAILYRDFARQRDDASVLVVRRRAG